MHPKIIAGWRVLTHRRADWAMVTPPPRLISSLIALTGLSVGIFLLVQDNSKYVSPAYTVMKHWGANAGFHARPMAFWGVLFTVCAVLIELAINARMPVLTGLLTLLMSTVHAFYVGALWETVGGPVSKSGAAFLTGVLVWWVITSGGLMGLRPGRKWPIR